MHIILVCFVAKCKANGPCRSDNVCVSKNRMSLKRELFISLCNIDLWYSVVVETTCPTKRKMSSGYVSLKKHTLEFLKSIRHVLACVFAPHFFNLYIWTMIDTIVFVSILIYPYFFFCNPSAVTRHKTAWQNDRIHCYDIASSIDSTLTTSHRHNAISCVSPRVLLRKFSTNYVIPRERCFSLSHYDRTP